MLHVEGESSDPSMANQNVYVVKFNSLISCEEVKYCLTTKPFGGGLCVMYDVLDNTLL